MSSAYVVANLLEKLNSADSDIRFMALADLNAELQRETNVLEDSSERKIVAAIVKSWMTRTVNLGPLVKKVREPHLQDIVDQLCNLLTEKKEELRDISAIGLKTVIAEIPGNNNVARNLIKRLIPKLNALLSKSNDVQLDTIDILAELLSRFGPILSSSDSAGQAIAQDPQLAKNIQDTLLPHLNHMRPPFASLFDDLVTKIRLEMKEKEEAKDYEKLRTVIVAISTLCRHSPRRLGKHLDAILPSILSYCKLDDDELRENCLQALEAFVLRCPTEITPHIQTLTALTLQYVKYDPNYEDDDDEQDGMDVDDEEEEDDADGMAEDEEEDYDDDEDYSDDDDVSWKVRRSSAKLLASIIGTRTELLPTLFADVAPGLISRFKEREESVRIEILSTFITLIRQVGAATRGQTKDDWKKSLSNLADPRTLLEQQVGRLSKSLSKQLSGKSVQTRQTGFILLKELVVVLEGGLDSRIGLFVGAIETSLAKSTGASDKGVNNPNLKIDPSRSSRRQRGQGQVYKITSEALLVVVQLLKVIRPLPASADASVDLIPPSISSEASAHVNLIYTTVLERLKTTDVDLEVKERSITALGTVAFQAGDILGEAEVKSTVVLSLLTAFSVTESPILGSFAGSEGLYPAAIASEVATFPGSHSASSWSATILQEVLEDLKSIVSESDLNIFPLAVNVIGAILNADGGGKLASVIRGDVTPKIVRLIVESPHLVLSGAGLEALLHYWQFVVVKGGSVVFQESAYRPLAQSIATLTLYCPSEAPSLVADFIGKIESPSTTENVRVLALLAIGEIGRSTDISKHSQTLHKVLLELFISPSDEIKHAAAFALGNISIGHLSFYLPFVFEAVRAGGKRRNHCALRPSATTAKLLAPYSGDLWSLLFANAEEVQDEGTRTVIAECLGKLALSDPGRFLLDLKERYTFTDSVSEEFDAVLGQLIVQFLRLVQDADLNVRRVSLHTLNSAAHNKPYLITSSLDELLPLLYNETVVKDELIHIVEMGPFKHRVDDGLDARKSAYECMFTLLETCLSRIEVFGFLDRVIHGLNDASQEIKTLSHVMLQRLAVLAPTALITRLESTIQPLRETINSKPKTNAVKQEIEKLNDLVRSAVRTALILSRTSRNAQGAILKECRAVGSPVADLFASVQAEIDAQHAMGVGRATLGGLAPMDLS
ncbi:armadillo-type protein [Chytridium lagenaria]|nr:armadillo-type protein [Chytridium lagenaria]